VVIGVGNELRGDDGIGISIARELRDAAEQTGIEVREAQGETIGLLDMWRGRDVVIVVDSMCGGGPAGTVRRFDASAQPLPARLHSSSSTHAFALDETIELGRALGRLPARVIVYAIEGRSFEARSGLSDEVETARPALAEIVLREARELAGA
jgi:hydrogenase maturation protease